MAMGIQYYIHIIEQLVNYTIIVLICITHNNIAVIEWSYYITYIKYIIKNINDAICIHL